MKETDIPTAFCEIVPVRGYPGKFLLRVDSCPHCGGTHCHGLPAGSERKRTFGHRVSHCGYGKTPGNGGYFLREKPSKNNRRQSSKNRK